MGMKVRVKAGWRGPANRPAMLLIGLLTAGAWFGRHRLHAAVEELPALTPAAGLALFALVVAFALILAWQRRGEVKRWRRRVAKLEGFSRLAGTRWIDRARIFVGAAEAAFAELLLRTALGRGMARDWQDAELPGSGGRYLLLALAFSALGWLIGAALGALLLAAALAVLFPIAPRSWVGARAATRRNAFKEQLPAVLDLVASGLAAGLSLPQAIAHAAEEATDPSARSWGRLSFRVHLGQTMEHGLKQLYLEQPDPAMALLVDGLSLQRRFGGDMIQMLQETAALLRERLELEREVHAVTAQARLSGAVVAALAPVSAGLLFLSNPQYAEVLFHTLWGQGLLVLALFLQLTGWALISRLIEIRY